jgi:hypothetical protein
MVGIECRRRAATLAREALSCDAKIVQADARAFPIERARAIVLFDVLHMMTHEEQDALLGTIAAQLEPGGVVLVRESDAAAGWRFTAVLPGLEIGPEVLKIFFEEIGTDSLEVVAEQISQTELFVSGEIRPGGRSFFPPSRARPPATFQRPTPFRPTLPRRIR